MALPPCLIDDDANRENPCASMVRSLIMSWSFSENDNSVLGRLPSLRSSVIFGFGPSHSGSGPRLSSGRSRGILRTPPRGTVRQVASLLSCANPFFTTNVAASRVTASLDLFVISTLSALRSGMGSYIVCRETLPRPVGQAKVSEATFFQQPARSDHSFGRFASSISPSKSDKIGAQIGFKNCYRIPLAFRPRERTLQI
jgi:hypothetical protein